MWEGVADGGEAVSVRAGVALQVDGEGLKEGLLVWEGVGEGDREGVRERYGLRVRVPERLREAEGR